MAMHLSDEERAKADQLVHVRLLDGISQSAARVYRPRRLGPAGRIR